MKKLFNIPNNVPAIVVVFLLLTSIFLDLAVSLFFNNKLNRMYRGLKAQTNESVETDSKDIVKVVNYRFNSSVPDAIRTYEPNGKYFTWKKVYEVEAPVDDKGVTLLYRSELDGLSYHPVYIAQYGLTNFGNYLETGDKKYLEVARKQADFFVDSIDPKTGLWYYDFDFAVGGTNEVLKAPWASAMAQGQAISLLARMYDATDEEKYFHTSKLAMKSFFINVTEGGVMRYMFGHRFLEEYPTILPNYTLNGFLFAVIGVYDLWYITGDNEAKALYEELINTVEFCLPFYDSNGITFYHLGHWNSGENLKPHYSEGYHLVHIEQLRVLNLHANSEIIEYYIDRWTSYVNAND